jgi:hypothetical protein
MKKRNIWFDTERPTLYLVVRLLVTFPGERYRESGANPELPRSGKQDRTPKYHWSSYSFILDGLFLSRRIDK